MARYNSSSATTTITGTATVSSPYSGAFTGLTGTAPYTVTLPAPTLFPGATQTFYNATAGTVTLSTPSGLFGGLGASGTGTLAMPTNTVTTVTSDGVNYIVLSEDGSALVATTGSFTGDVAMNGSLVNIAPSTLTLSPTSSGTLNNVSIGGTTRAAGSFVALNANGQVNFTANTASSSTTTGTLVVTGGIGASGTIYAGGFNGNLTGTIQTAAQTNITSLGTIASLSAGSVSASLTVNAVGGILANGENFEKYLGVKSFTDGVANRAINVQFGNFALGGRFEITITGTYSNQNAGGGITKVFSVLTNPSNSIYTNESRVTTVVGPIVSNFAIGEFQWDGTQYIIPISHIVSTGNPVYVHIKVYGMGNTANVCNNVTLSDLYTLSPLSRNYEYYNGPLGIGTTNPDAQLHIKTGSTGTNFKLEGPTGRYLYSGNDSGTYLEQVGTSASDRVFRIQNSNGFGAYTQLVFDGANQKIYTSSNVNVGIGMNNPQTILHVSGTNQNIFLDNFGVGQTGLKLRYQTNSLHGANFLYTPSDATAFIENVYQSSSGTVYGDIYFRQNIAGTMTTRMTIKADGGTVSTSNDIAAGGKSSARSQRVQMGIFSANTTSGDSNTYWHFKTSIKANRDVTMQAVIAEGFAYGSATLIDCRWGWHTDSSGNLYNRAYLTNGSGPSANNLYVAADGFTVVVLYVSSTYYSSVTFRYIQSEMYGETPFSITAWTRTTSSSGAY